MAKGYGKISEYMKKNAYKKLYKILIEKIIWECNAIHFKNFKKKLS